MDFEKLAKLVEKLEKNSGKIADAKADKIASDPRTAESVGQSMKNFAEALRDVLIDFLHERREPVRPGHMYRDAAAKGIVPGDLVERGDNLLIRWSGRVTPIDPKVIADDAVHFGTFSKAVVPVLKAYKKEDEAKKAKKSGK